MELHFGFSYIGFLFLVMLMIPNLLWTKNTPKDYEKYVGREKKGLLLLERLGEILVTCFSLIFRDFHLRPVSPWTVFLLSAFFLMILYELYWVRYFRSAKTMGDFYSSFFGIPVAGATLPVLAFLCLGIYGRNLFLIFADLILGIGHIGIHLHHAKEGVPNDSQDYSN